MSRIGKLPVSIPDNVNVKIDGNQITVKGPLGTLSKEVSPICSVEIEDNEVIVKRHGESKDDRSMQGMTRSIIDSMVEGVSDGFEKKLEMIGVGYGAKMKGKGIELEAGYSHPVEIEADDNIEFDVEKGPGNIEAIITVKGIDKQKVGEVAARIREIRKPEPYKGKGIKYSGEQIMRKEGKTG